MQRKPLLEKTLHLLTKLFAPPSGRVRLSRNQYYDRRTGQLSGPSGGRRTGDPARRRPTYRRDNRALL